MICSIWHSGFEIVTGDNMPLFFHIEVASMISKTCDHVGDSRCFEYTSTSAFDTRMRKSPNSAGTLS
jgi:hypothetical protein